MTRRPFWIVLLAIPAFAASVALAGGGEDPKKKGEPDKAKAEAEKGPEIAWAKNYADAVEESMERNVPIYLHSHGST